MKKIREKKLGMNKYHKIVIGGILLAVLAVFCVLDRFKSEDEISEYAIYKLNDNWNVANDIGVSLPYAGQSEPGELVAFETTVPRQYGGMTLSFYSIESTVRVSLDDEIIYKYGVDSQRMFGKSPGSRVNFVDLPERIGEGRLRIEFTSSYINAATVLYGVSVSERDIAILQLIEENLVNLFCCIIVLVSAIVLLVAGIVCIFTDQNTRGVFWLAALGIDVGLYYLFKTEMLSVFFGARAIYSMGQYLFIMLVPIFFLLYLEKDLEKMYPRIFTVLYIAVNLNVFIQLILQVNNIFDLADMVDYTAMLFRLVLVIGIFLYGRAAVVHRKKENWFMAAGGVLLLMGEIRGMDVGVSIDPLGGKVYSQYAMTLFLFILAGYHVIQVTQDYKKEAEENARLALAANEAKGKFLANMSHEIRTPINAVLGMDEMILREATEPRIREYAMDIFTAGNALLTIINDILDLSKIESGKMEIVPANYDVSSMIHDLSNMAEIRAKKKKLQLHVEADREIPCTLCGDDVRIRQVLTNILTNAVKYTHEGDIWFRIRKELEDEKKVMLYFEVEDTGIGIKEEDLPKLYAEFERIEEDRNRNIEGTGLGMSITLQLLEMMGSRLQMESAYGKGSRFFFYLEQDIVDRKPIGDFEQNVQQLAAEYVYMVSFTAPDAEVLVVDDNAINRKVFGNLLHQTEVKITEAESGMQCLALIKQKQFDIIFLDHMMPEMDGLETLRRMRTDSGNLSAHAPVIALTANAISGAKQKYLEAGFDDYLSKPIVSEKLEKMLWDYLPKELIREVESTEEAQVLDIPSGKPDLEELPMVEGLDWHYAWMHLSDMDLLQSTIRAFYEQIGAAGEKLDDCYRKLSAGEGFDAYRIQVHAMKSLAATVGILPLAGAAKLLEDAAKKEEAETVHSLHGIFLREWNGYLEKLVGVFDIRPPEEKPEMEDSSIICALLEMIRIAMEEMNVDEADEKIKMVCAYRYQENVQKNVELLKAAVENLDAEQTESCVQTIIGQLSGQGEKES